MAEGDSVEDDRDEYERFNMFCVPEVARWYYIIKQATNPDIGKVLDYGFYSHRKRKKLAGILPKNYSVADIDQPRVGRLLWCLLTTYLYSPNRTTNLGGINGYT